MKISIKVRTAGKRLRPSYRRGIEFIALNMDAHNMTGDPAVLVLAEAFGKPAEQVARDVRRCYNLHMGKDRS